MKFAVEKRRDASSIDFHQFDRRKAKRASLAAAVASVILFAAGSAFAATDQWSGKGTSNAGSTTWEATGNWSLGHAPLSTDDAFFATGFSSGTFIYYDANHTIGTFYDDTTTGFSLNQNGSTTGLTLTSGVLYEYGLTGMGAQSIQQVTLATNGNIDLYGDNVFTIQDLQQSGGTRTVSNNGSGWLQLQQIQTTGAITASAGVLEYAGGSSEMSNSSTTVSSGATLQTDADMTAPLTIAGVGARGLGAWCITDNSGLYSGASIFMSSNVTLSAAATINVQSDVQLYGNISDGGSFATLTKTGPATLSLFGTNTGESGEIYVTNGIVDVSANTASPGSIYATTGGTVSVDSLVSVTCPIIATGTGYLGLGAISGSGGIYANSVYLTGNTTIGGSETITGVISDALGTNTLTFSGLTILTNANLYKGGTIINGLAQAANSGAFSSGAITVNPLGQLSLLGNINVANSLSIAGGNAQLTGDLYGVAGASTLSGVMTLTSNNLINVDIAPGASLTLTGSISDGAHTSGFKLIDSGTLYLAGIAASTYKGGLIVNDGVADVINPAALGASTVYVDNPLYANASKGSAQLQVQGGITINRPLVLSGGYGIGSLGLVHSTTGSNIWSGGLTVFNTLSPGSAIGVDSGGTLTFLSAAVTGTGNINKVGLGRLVLESAVSVPAVNVNAGEVQFASGVALPAGLNVNVINAAAAEINDLIGGGIAGASTFNLIGNGVGQTGALRTTGATTNATLNGNVHLLANSSIGVDSGDTLAINAPSTIDDAGNAYSLTKVGGGILTLAGASTYTGGLNINGGSVKVGADGSLGPSINQVTINNGAKLEFTQSASTARTINANNGTIQIDTPANQLSYTNDTVTGGFLRGAGTHAFGANTNFIGTTVDSGATVVQTGASNLTNFTNGGTFTDSNGGLIWDAGSNAPSGVLNFLGNASLDSFTNNGVITINPGVTVTNTAANLFLGAGSRMYVGSQPSPGGTLTLQNGTTLEVNDALLVNDGTISGTTDVNYGGTAQGIGTYGPVNVSFGGVFQPGFTSNVVLASNGANVSALTGNGIVDNINAGGTLNLNVNTNIASTFSGIIQNTSGSLSLTVAGSGSLTLLSTTLPNGTQSTNSYTGGTSINGGTLTIGAAGALPAGSTVVNNGTLNILANSLVGKLTGTGALNIAAGAQLKLSPASGPDTEGALTITAGSQLDITTNSLALNYGSPGNDPVTTIRADLVAAYKAKYSGASLAITSSTAAGAPAAFAIGYVDNNTTHQLTFALTVPGDTNLSGSTDFNDLTTVAQFFGQSSAKGNNVGWQTGDVNYDGNVDFNDLTLVAQYFGDSLTKAEAANLPASFVAQYNLALAEVGGGGGTSSVPEPGSIALLALTTGGLLARRRRARA